MDTLDSVVVINDEENGCRLEDERNETRIYMTCMVNSLEGF